MQSPPARIASQIRDIPCRDLSGYVERKDKTTGYADHNGGYADVFIGTLKGHGEPGVKVAIKVMRVVNENERVDKIRRYLIRETTVWHQLDHPNVLKFLGLAYDHERFGCPALISPYCDNGTVNNYLDSHSDNDTKLFIMRGVADGLRYLHQMEIIHGDLKPSNVLIHDDGHPLLCDFGRSKILIQRGFTTRPLGAARYQAPEHIQGIGPNKATDVYAFALTSYEGCFNIWSGVQPFRDIQGPDYALIYHIVIKDAKPACPIDTSVDTDPVWTLFTMCWKTEVEERPTVEAVVESLANINLTTS